ncbi:MAG: hypothetical protein ACYTG0_37390 [Planctomycetota bacterium]
MEGSFEARTLFCADNRADGAVSVEFREFGLRLDLRPVVYVNVHSLTSFPRAVVVYLPRDLDGPPGPDDYVVGTVGPDPTDPPCQLWDFTGSDIQESTGPTRLEFTAAGEYAFVEERCEPLDLGLLDSGAKIDVPAQTVFPLGGGGPLEFEACVQVHRDNTAHGFIDVPLSEQGRRYEVFHGAVLPGVGNGGPLVFLVGVLSDPGDVVNANDTLRATVTLIPEVEDIVYWDLLNGTSGEVQNVATFDATADHFILTGQGAAPLLK